MKTAILGTGSVGAYFGGHLAHAGEDVAFLARSTYEPIKRNGLTLEGPDGRIHVPQPKIFREAAECGPVDLVLVCWKTYLNHQLAQSLPPLLHENTLVLTTQNGMGNAEAIAGLVPQERVGVALCFSSFMPAGPGVFRNLGANDTRLAPMAETDTAMAQVAGVSRTMEKAGIHATSYESMEDMLWRKLIINIPFNGVSLAEGGLTGGQLATLPGAAGRMRGIMEEICRAAELRGHPLPAGTVDKEIARILHLVDFIPSSAQDYLNGRPVEYEAIWETPLQRALEAGAEAPLWQELCRDIRRRIGRE